MTKKEPAVKKERDMSPPPPPARVKKEKEDRDRDRSNGTTTASQRRRESAMYTSSEEEGEEGEDTSGTSLMRNNIAARKAANGNANGTKSLRARYQASYMTYLDTFRTAMSQKERIEALLEGGSEAGDAASLSEGELLDFDGLNKLVGETKSKWEELKGIQREWEGSRGSKSSMVGVGRE
ncbi:hypothetical protein MPER_08599 [Moniliophthora perniciosa FA553]|nr:hypothetical protein MPER_08599 [Moniliophthora perniciosa FA553]